MLGCQLELLEALLVILVVFVTVQHFVTQPYQVQQESMENTLLPDQYVLVDKITPHFDAYHRGDIIVFNPPAGSSANPNGTPYIKRVIGVGGDTVTISDGHVFVNGTQIREPYLFEGQPTLVPGGGSKTWTVTAAHLFVMGDHRQASDDSREFGLIATSAVIGRVWLRYWPINDFEMMPGSGQAPVASNSPAASAAASPGS